MGSFSTAPFKPHNSIPLQTVTRRASFFKNTRSAGVPMDASGPTTPSSTANRRHEPFPTTWKQRRPRHRRSEIVQRQISHFVAIRTLGAPFAGDYPNIRRFTHRLTAKRNPNQRTIGTADNERLTIHPFAEKLRKAGSER